MTPETTRFTLYIAGQGELAQHRQANFKRHVADQFGSELVLDVVDVVAQPRLARERRVLATPLLVREQPGPIVKILGDLSDGDRVRQILGISLGSNLP